MGVQNRNINLDALRVFAVFGVVTLHVLGGVETLNLSSSNRLLVNFLLAVTYCSVNLFGLLSGYLKIDRNHHNASLIKIVFQTVFWCFVITIICAIFFDQRSPFSLLKNAFPFIGDRLWYITCYCFVFVCAPYLNLVASRLSQRNYRKLMILLVILMSFVPTFLLRDYFHIINHGYSVGWLIYMYLLGGYFKKFGFSERLTKIKVGMSLLACVLLITASRYVIEFLISKIGITANVSLQLYYYCSPLMLLVSVLFLYLFVTANIKNKADSVCLSWISKVSLGVYIIHAHPYSLDYLLVGKNLEWTIFNNPLVTLLVLVCVILAIVIGTGLLEQLRIVLFKILKIDNAIKKLGQKLDRILNIEDIAIAEMEL